MTTTNRRRNEKAREIVRRLLARESANPIDDRFELDDVSYEGQTVDPMIIIIIIE
jgi:hypothetical protein